MAVLDISGYQVLRKLGEGGMATVYLARQHSLGRDVAVKILNSARARDPAALAQFRLEAHAVANLKHPNILQVYEAGDTGGIPYVAMEYVPGGSIEEWAANAGRVSGSDALAIDGAIEEQPPGEQPEPEEEREAVPGEIAEADYLALVEAHRPVFALARRGRFSEAERMLRSWMEENPVNAHAAEALRSAERLRRAAGLARVLQENAARLQDVELPSLPRGARVVGVGPEGLQVRRSLDVGAADWAVPFDRISIPEMLALLAAADPDAAAVHGAVFCLAQVRLPEASLMLDRAERTGREVDDLHEWRGHWEAMLLALTPPPAPSAAVGEEVGPVGDVEPAGEETPVTEEPDAYAEPAGGMIVAGRDGYPGRAGSGWASGWQTRGSGERISAGTSDPAGDGGPGLRVEVPAGVREMHLYRQLNLRRPVDLGAPHEMRIRLRIDDAQAFDRHRGEGASVIRIVNADTPNPNDSAHTWWIGAFTQMQGGNWRVRSFERNDTVHVDTGIRPTEGVSYTFEIRVFPAESRYAVSLTDSRRGRWNSDRQHRSPLLFRGATPLTRSGQFVLFNVQKAHAPQTVDMRYGFTIEEIRIWNIEP